MGAYRDQREEFYNLASFLLTFILMGFLLHKQINPVLCEVGAPIEVIRKPAYTPGHIGRVCRCCGGDGPGTPILMISPSTNGDINKLSPCRIVLSSIYDEG